MPTTLCQVVAIGDAHLKPGERQADRLRALDAIIDAGLQLPHLGAWFWAGDVFDAKSTIADRNELAERLVRMANAAPVIGCRGNHDAAGDLAVFEKLSAKWPIVFPERPRLHLQDLPTGHTLLTFALPWPEEGGLAAAGVAPGDVPAAAREALTSIFVDAGEKLATARSAGFLTAFIGHCTVVGAVSSNGQPQAGLGIEIDAAHLAHLGDCPQIVNHIHKAQRVGSAIYPGSICRLSWGETEPKRFLVVNWFDREDFVIDEQPLDVAPMYAIEGELSREGFRYELPGDRAPLDGAAISWEGCEVRVRARFPAALRDTLDLAKAHILAEFAGARRLQLELVAVPDAGLRAPAVATAQTLREKLLAWGEASGTVVPDAVLERLTALQTSEPDQVVASVRTIVDALLAPAVSQTVEAA